MGRRKRNRPVAESTERQPHRRTVGSDVVGRPTAPRQLPGFTYDALLDRYFRIPPPGEEPWTPTPPPPSTPSSMAITTPPPPPPSRSVRASARSANLLWLLLRREHGSLLPGDASCITRALARRLTSPVLPTRHRFLTDDGNHYVQHMVIMEQTVAVVYRKGNQHCLFCLEIVEFAGGGGGSPHLGRITMQSSVKLELRSNRTYQRPVAALACFTTDRQDDVNILVAMNGTLGAPAVAHFFPAADPPFQEDADQLPASFAVCRGAVFSCCVQPQRERRLLAFGAEGAVWLLRMTSNGGVDAKSLARLEVGNCGEQVRSVRWSECGDMIYAVTSRGWLNVWRETSPPPRFLSGVRAQYHSLLKVAPFGAGAMLSDVRPLNFTSGELLVSGARGQLVAVDRRSGAVLRRYAEHQDEGRAPWLVADEAWNVLLATGQDGVTRVWRLSGRQGGQPLVSIALPLMRSSGLPSEQPRSVWCDSPPALIIGYDGGLDLYRL